MRHLISVCEGPPGLDAQLLESSAHPKYPPVPGAEGGTMTLASECFSKALWFSLCSFFTPS